MQKKFLRSMIYLKVIFLTLSIVLFLYGQSLTQENRSQNADTKVFTIDLMQPLSSQVSAIHQYLIQNTGQALGLATVISGKVATILPATTDYETYAVYLDSFSADTNE